MTKGQSFYDILGVKTTTDRESIRRAFKTKVLTAHPDHGGDEEDFRQLQTAYEVLSDWRKRRIYDRYGEEGLDLNSEALFTTTFRGGVFGPDDKKQLIDELQTLRASNESLQRQLMIVRPETTSKFASSFEAWLRNRSPDQLRVITSDTLAEELGVAEGTYEPTPLPRLTSERIEIIDIGSLASVQRQSSVVLPERLMWNQTLVRWLVCPLVAADSHLAQWGFIPGEEVPEHPFVGGAEGIGVVIRTGPGADNVQEGDLVVPVRPTVGTWQTLGIHNARDLQPIPPVSVEVPVLANLMSYIAAYRLLEAFGDIRPGDTVVQSQADSPVGQAVIQLCGLLHLKSINLVADGENFDELDDLLRAHGATHVWRNSGSIAERIKRAGGAAPRLGLDSIGGSTLHRIAECLRPGGTLVSYGASELRVDPFPFVPLLHRGLELRGFWLYGWLRESRDNYERMVDHLLPLVEEGKLAVRQATYTVADLAAACADPRHVALTFGTLEEANALSREIGSQEHPEHASTTESGRSQAH